jgi:biopolymer transport protein ExbD
MIRRFRSRRSENARMVALNVIPLIDIVFFLLVFYVINASFEAESSVSIARPSSAQARTVGQGYVPVVITKSGSVYVNARLAAVSELSSAVGAALQDAGTDRAIIQADREVGTGQLLQVMDACSAGGAARVEVAALRAVSP